MVGKSTKKIIFVRAASFKEVTTDTTLFDKVKSDLQKKFSMKDFVDKLTQNLKDEGVDLSDGFVDSGNVASRETMRLCMKNFGANGEAPRSLLKRYGNSDGPAFNLAFVDEVNRSLHLAKDEIVCVFVHEDDTPHKMLHHVDLSTAQKLWNEGYAELERSGDILVVEYGPKGSTFKYKEFK